MAEKKKRKKPVKRRLVKKIRVRPKNPRTDGWMPGCVGRAGAEVQHMVDDEWGDLVDY